MYTTNLRKVGGSIMVALPPAFLDQLDLKVGAKVGIAVTEAGLLVNAKPKPRYTLAELLAERDSSAPRTAEEQAWIDMPPVGRELL
jgi:antitoxin ChpS